MKRSSGDILLFVDDDASLGHQDVLDTIVEVLLADRQTAIVGVSQLIPPTVTRFQRSLVAQVPRSSYPVVSEHQISNPPLDHFGFTAITTRCCAVRRSVFEEVGGFNEALTSGEDPDFFYRVRHRGYNLIVAANCWVYHDPPSSLKILLHKSFWYGMGHAMEARMSPERGMDVLHLHRWYGWPYLVAALLAFPFAFFIHYYFSPVRRFVFGFRPYKTLSTYACLLGYVYGWYYKKSATPVTHQEIQVSRRV